MVNPFVWLFYKVAPYTVKIPMMNNYEDVVNTNERIEDMEQRHQEYINSEEPFYYGYLASMSANNIKFAKNLVGFIITAWYLQVLMAMGVLIAIFSVIYDILTRYF